MVHQTISTSSNRAPSASRISSSTGRFSGGWRGLAWILGGLCAAVTAWAQAPASVARWIPANWSELPGFEADALHEAWNAWVRSCERPAAPFAALCREVRPLSLASDAERRRWMVDRLQPFRLQAADGAAQGLLTGYFEPELEASRDRTPGFAVPLYRPPSGLGQRRPWHTRQEIDSEPSVRALLAGREIAYLADPLDALLLQIQGSGRLRLREPDGRVRPVRLAYAGSNDHPYQSVGRWLLDQGAVSDASWPGIRSWAARYPERLDALLWSNPRYVFFREESLTPAESAWGPRGAQGVALTPGRSIAVDPASIPYGTPVWLSSAGPTPLHRLVLAQDTGQAITGAVRADYFAGWGDAAAELAGRLKQPLRLWALWPKR
ncbi:MAG: transglycosylase [Rhodoferax sp.]|nr:transglycosylase [Rhodoferax sp.]